MVPAKGLLTDLGDSEVLEHEQTQSYWESCQKEASLTRTIIASNEWWFEAKRHSKEHDLDFK